MNAIRGVVAILTLLIAVPIWYYLLYKVLQAVNASEVMWLLYWIYLPVGIIAQALQKLLEAAAES